MKILIVGYYTSLLGDKHRTLSQFLAGGTAGVMQWLPPIYFTDIIKSRMQTAPLGTYRGVLHCVSTLYAEGGIAIFFRGLIPALCRAGPLHAIIFVVYEQTSAAVKDYQKKCS
jgi:hypothetical protein